MPKCKIIEGFGPIAGAEGFIVGTCPGAPAIYLVLLGDNLRYIHEDNLILLETNKDSTNMTIDGKSLLKNETECYNCGCNLREVCPGYNKSENEMLVKYTKVHENAKTPKRAYPTDAGMDFFYCGDDQIRIDLGCSAVIPTGIKMEVPEGYMLEIKNKSGIASKNNLITGACVVDTGYSGEIFVNLHNVGLVSRLIEPGDKIAQGVFVKIAESISLVESDSIYNNEPTDRGDGALGSTGDR